VSAPHEGGVQLYQRHPSHIYFVSNIVAKSPFDLGPRLMRSTCLLRVSLALDRRYTSPRPSSLFTTLHVTPRIETRLEAIGRIHSSGPRSKG